MNKNNDFEDIEFIDMGNNDNNSIPDTPVQEEPVSSGEPAFYVDLDEPEEEPPVNEPEPVRKPKKKSSMSRAERRRRRRRKIMIRRAIFCAALIVFFVSATMLVKYLLDYRKGDKIYENVEQSVFNNDTPAKPTSGNSNTSTDPSAAAAPESVLLTNYDHDALLALNQHAVGYLQIPALNVLLPVVQGDDNDYYLSHAITGESSKNGTLFIDCRNLEGIESQNAIIYGHNMKNGSMFGSLNKFKDAKFFSTGDNKYMYFYIQDKIYKYEIYSVHETPATSSTYTTEFQSSDAFFTYINTMIQASLHENPVDVYDDSRTITLSTCTNDDNTRLVIQAVRTDILYQ